MKTVLLVSALFLSISAMAAFEDTTVQCSIEHKYQVPITCVQNENGCSGEAIEGNTKVKISNARIDILQKNAEGKFKVVGTVGSGSGKMLELLSIDSINVTASVWTENGVGAHSVTCWR